MADFVYLDPRTAGIGYAIALAGIPVYWLRSLVGREGRAERRVSDSTLIPGRLRLPSDRRQAEACPTRFALRLGITPR